MRRIEIALNEAGAALSDVIRTRIYVTDVSRWREVAVIAPELLVEIEADAYSAISPNVPSAEGR